MSGTTATMAAVTAGVTAAVTAAMMMAAAVTAMATGDFKMVPFGTVYPGCTLKMT